MCSGWLWYTYLLYKHQWTTSWAFVWKHDIFTFESNVLFSHVKRSRMLWLHNELCLLKLKTVLSQMVWHSLMFNITLHGHLEIQNFSSSVEKYFTSKRSEWVEYFSTLEEKFRIPTWPCNILYIFSVGCWCNFLEKRNPELSFKADIYTSAFVFQYLGADNGHFRISNAWCHCYRYSVEFLL